MQKVLITGGAGFIGSHLAEYYINNGYKVDILDDLSTGRIENLSKIKDNNDINIVIDSVMNTEIVDKMVKESDFVVHLAAAVGVEYIINNPLKSIETNIIGTENILKSCDRYCKKVLIASTSEVYGKNENIPFSEEDDSVIGPTRISRWSYACSKAMDEFLALAYYKVNNLPVIIMRFFNTCGPRQTGRYGMVIPRFVKQALNNEDLTVYGDGKQTRCFTHVDDVVKCLVSLAESKDAYGEVFNIGSENRISIEDLAKLCIEITNSKSNIKRIAYEEAFSKEFEDMRHRAPNINKLTKLIGFKPEKDIENIISDVIKWYSKEKL